MGPRKVHFFTGREEGFAGDIDLVVENTPETEVMGIVAELERELLDCDFVDDLDEVSSDDVRNDLIADREGKFSAVCVRIIDLIDNERRAQRKPLLDEDDKVILVYEIFRTFERYKNEVRKDGSSVFYSHLVGAVENLIVKGGFTSVSSVLAMLKHDWVEDFVDKKASPEERRRRELELKNELIEYLLYLEKLENHDAKKKIEVIRLEVQELVMGVTKSRKIRKGKEHVKKTVAATLKRLLNLAYKNPRVLAIKIADRAHNMKTLSGHGNDAKGLAKQRAIVQETLDVFLPLARILGLRELYREILLDCVQFLNPKLKEDYEIVARKRWEDRLEKRKAAIKAKLKNLPSGIIYNVKFVNKGLDSYVTRVQDKSLEEMKIEDLHISTFDPCFEILITVELGENEGAEKLMKVRSSIIENFASGNGASVETSNPGEKDPNRIRGIDLMIFSAEYGGALHFRINDEVAEARSKRGIMAMVAELPQHMKGEIEEIIDERHLLEAANVQLLKPRIVVLTKDGHEKQLPEGATALDFAGEIHDQVLIGMQAVYVDEPLSKSGERKVSPFEPLERRKAYRIVSCMTKEHSDPDQIKVLPEWMLFCKNQAAAVVRNYFKKGNFESHESRVQAGKEYFKRMINLFKISPVDFENVLLKKYGNKYKCEDEDDRQGVLDKIFADMTIGQIDPIQALAESLERRQKKSVKQEKSEKPAVRNPLWAIAVDLSDAPGRSREFLSDFFKAEGIDVRRAVMLGEKAYDRPGMGHISMELDLSGAKITLYAFFKKLLQLNFSYQVTNIRNMNAAPAQVKRIATSEPN